MKSLRAPLLESDAFSQLHTYLRQPAAIARLTDCADAVKPYLIDALGESYTYRVVITHSDARARKLYEDFLFYDRFTTLYPAKDLIFYQADIQAGEIVRERLRSLRKILEGRPLTVIVSFAALMAPQAPLETFRAHMLSVEKGATIEPVALAKKLTEMGYERSHQAETPGQFAVRGDIVDIFDVTEENPYRIELWGDEVDSIRIFDATTQRSIEQIDRAPLFPATEMILTKAQYEEGFRKIEKDAEQRTQELRKKMLTEEAHRLSSAIAELKERVLTLSMRANLESYLRYFYDEPASFLSLFDGANACFFLDEPARIAQQAEAVETEFIESMTARAQEGYILPPQMDALFSTKRICALLSKRRRVLLEELPSDAAVASMFPNDEKKAKRIPARARGVAPYNNRFDALVKDLKRYRQERYRVLILSGSRARAKRLVEDLRDNDVVAFYSEDPSRALMPGEIMTYYGQLSQGFAFPDGKLAVIAESDIFSARQKKRRRKSKYRGDRIGDFNDLKVGDYVVHEDHGLGVYRGIEQITVDRVVKDYLKIEYAQGGVLYVTATGLSVLQKYAAGDGAADDKRKIKLNRLGASDWAHTKAKTRSAVDEIAEDLVELYAKRMKAQGHAFPADTVWQQEFEDAFPYEETDDQARAIEEMKRDMESPRAMDRLICGDVGFGKTEIAIRGAFKAAQDSKQVAVLAPTTILAQQHYNTFVERFKNFPVRIDLLSRFRSQREQKRTVEDLKKGLVDIVIGTHRLLSKDVAYRDLGLLIVDEEQRFGVSHKEKIKKLKENVDVLTLTATPIPRTLHMSLTGIRDMSLLEEAPLDRLPIQTFVCEYNDAMVREAIMRELSRNGQVYYVYNRVDTIADVAGRIQKLAPEARVAFAHGKMQEAELERVMYDFIAGDVDVLVSTTIIETGLDIPNVNTMIIHGSDQLGLAQLYQLRGRVGRSNRAAYAFLMYKRDKVLREVAEKRLSAIREFTDLGSGYRIAMRDLEIRGAGNLLGAKQSGHMAAVGYEMYCRMLEEAVRKLKGEDDGRPARFTTNVDLPVDAHIPETYILNVEQKLEIYKRIASMTTMTESEEIRDELIDRFGAAPPSVDQLIRVSLIRVRANRLFVTELKGDDQTLTLTLREDAPLDGEKVALFLQTRRDRIRFRTTGKPAIVYRWKTSPYDERFAENVLTQTEELLDGMERAWNGA